ncbi:hypothetical protein [Syntrophomonas curvata]
MKTKKYVQASILALLAVFVLGVAVPAMAGGNNPAAAGEYGKAGVSRGARTMVAALAELAGKDVSDVQAQRHGGKTILDIAKDNGIDEQTLVNQISARNQERLKANLDAGRITQEQYDSCMNNMQQNIKERLEGPESGRGCCRGAGFRNGGAGQDGCNGGQGICGNRPIINNGSSAR